jgi:hypothetical protein
MTQKRADEVKPGEFVMGKQVSIVSVDAWVTTIYFSDGKSIGLYNNAQVLIDSPTLVGYSTKG